MTALRLTIFADLHRANGGYSSYTATVPIQAVPEIGETISISGMRFTMNVLHQDSEGHWQTYATVDGRVGLESVRRKLKDAGFKATSYYRPTRRSLMRGDS